MISFVKKNEKLVMKKIKKMAFAFSQALSRLSKSPIMVISLCIIFSWFVIAIAGPLITPYDPYEFHHAEKFHPPSPRFFFGTDKFGRDIFSRVLTGSRPVLIIASFATLLSTAIGTSIGLVSGYIGGLFDELNMRFMDILMSFPGLLLAMFILGMVGQSIFAVIVVISAVFSPRVARVARSAVLELRHKPFIEAAKVRGESTIYILFVELLPNIVGPVGVEAAVRFGYAIFMSASLGFLGLGVQPPTPGWGIMVSEAQGNITYAPWTVLFPSLAISSIVVAVNFLSDGLRRLESGDL